MVTTFKTKNDQNLLGVSLAALSAMRDRTATEYGIRPAQVVESSSYSMAMVVRYALGLSATGGAVMCLFDRTIRGAIVLATARHLWNAGCSVRPYELPPSTLPEPEPEVEAQLRSLRALGATPSTVTTNDDVGRFAGDLEHAHNLLCGLGSPFEVASPLLSKLLELMNEARTPVHTIECPPGVDPDDGKNLHLNALYASSTLSLGAPLDGLWHGHPHVGRHYLCDNSIPEAVYEPYAPKVNSLFSEQPVIQIFPVDPPDE